MLRLLLPLCLLAAPWAAAQNSREIRDLRKSAKKGAPAAQYKLGMAYADAYQVKRDYDKAAEWLQRAAEQDHVRAQEYLGKMYFTGAGVPKDRAEAAKWLSMSAELGNPEAQVVLGSMYNNGDGVPLSYDKAAYWYRMAAEQGFSQAQFNLGVMYNNGEGVPQSIAEAYKWIHLAALDENAESVAEYVWARDDIARSMEPEALKDTRRRLGEWKPRSWEQLQDDEQKQH